MHGRERPANMPKLQKIGGPSILHKMDNHMRSTHLRLDPIESAVGGITGNASGLLTTHGNEGKGHLINQSVQF